MIKKFLLAIAFLGITATANADVSVRVYRPPCYRPYAPPVQYYYRPPVEYYRWQHTPQFHYYQQFYGPAWYSFQFGI